MTNRERFENTMRYAPVDHPPLILDAPWPRTIERWHREGWPAGVSLYDYFNLEPFNTVNVGPASRIWPGWVEHTLEVKGDDRFFIDSRGIRCRTGKDYQEGIEYLEYPVKGRADQAWLDARMNPDDPTRWDNGWGQRLASLDPSTDLGTIEFGSFFGDLHEHTGTERMCMLLFEEPDFVHWYNDRIAACAERAIERMLPDDRIVFMSGHEDMAFKNGSFISPEMFREFLTPYYRRTVGAARARGQTLFQMDSDGNLDQLIPQWLELGVNLITPMEAAAGMDVARLRSEFGRGLLMLGGIDKRALIAGGEQIRREVQAKERVIRDGGYIPRLDHSVSPDISWENYKTYVATLKALYGM
jgi:uroporphyrinogen decarboxylase